MLCASACQRCCSALTAATRSTGSAAKALASSIMAWRRAKAWSCAACKGACASCIRVFHCGWMAAKAFSPMWPPLRQRSANACSSRACCFQSWLSACAKVQARTSSIRAWRWALVCSDCSLTCLSQASTHWCNSTQAVSNALNKVAPGKAPWAESARFHCSRKPRSCSCNLRPPTRLPSGAMSKACAWSSKAWWVGTAAALGLLAGPSALATGVGLPGSAPWRRC